MGRKVDARLPENLGYPGAREARTPAAEAPPGPRAHATPGRRGAGGRPRRDTAWHLREINPSIQHTSVPDQRRPPRRANRAPRAACGEGAAGCLHFPPGSTQQRASSGQAPGSCLGREVTWGTHGGWTPAQHRPSSWPPPPATAPKRPRGRGWQVAHTWRRCRWRGRIPAAGGRGRWALHGPASCALGPAAAPGPQQ